MRTLKKLVGYNSRHLVKENTKNVIHKLQDKKQVLRSRLLTSYSWLFIFELWDKQMSK